MPNYLIIIITFYTLNKSSYTTLPAQNIFLSAKYYVAKSPIGNFDKTIYAPALTIISNFSYISYHSASTIY